MFPFAPEDTIFAFAHTGSSPEIVVSPTGPAWRVFIPQYRVNDACINLDRGETQFVARCAKGGISCKSLPMVAGTAVHDRFPWDR